MTQQESLPAPEVSVLVLTWNRLSDLKCCVGSVLRQRDVDFELIVVDNGSTDGTADYIEGIRSPRIKAFYNNENLGVCGGRNVGLENACGKYVVVLDDDIEILDASLLRKVRDKFLSDDSLGGLAFRIVDFNTGEIDNRFFPSRNKKRNKFDGFQTSWFIGAGHAMAKSAIDKVGLYRDFFPYGSEEFDYSLRIIDAGFDIEYFPSACVLHKETLKSRLPKAEITALRLKHRVKAAALNLPWINVLSILVIRSLIVLLRNRFNVRVVAMAWFGIFKSFPSWQSCRQPLGRNTMKKLRNLGGNVYY